MGNKNSFVEEQIINMEKTENKSEDFYSGIIREIRTPLNVILGTADLLREKTTNEKINNEYVIPIQENARLLASLIDDMMELSNIRKGESKQENAAFDIMSIIGEIADSYEQRSSSKKNVSFNVYMNNISESYLYGDEHKVYQILDGVLKTMYELTGKTGDLSLVVEQLGDINDNIKNDDVTIRFTIKSSGGNTNEQYADLNEWARGNIYIVDDTSYDSKFFGLSMSNYLVELLGGSVNYKMVDEVLELNIDLEFQKILNQIQDEEIANIRTLFIYDTSSSSEEQQEMMKNIGMRYDSCHIEEDILLLMENAQKAGKPYQVVILDWNLNKLSVLVTIREIRNVFGEEQIIIFTDINTKSMKNEAKKAGADFVIDRYRFMSTTKKVLKEVSAGEYHKQKSENVQNKNYNFEGRLILIAEDVSLNMQIIVKMLSKVNASVICVENGQEAINAFLSKPEGFFDCIFMDINMPVMDGYDATKAIRESDRADANIPIYAMSANAMHDDIVKSLDCGMNGHIEKPVNEGMLYRILDKLFSADNKVNEKTKELQQENEALREKAEHDPLTGLLNRYGFETNVEELIDKPMCVGYLIMDVDYFKSVNDTYGHDTGDQILIKVANLLKQTFREGDYIVRLGGDEFVVLLTNCDEETSFVSKRIDRMNEILRNPDDGLPAVSISAGVVFSEMGYQKDMYLLADKALYKTKQNGRGHCTVKGEN